MQPLFEHRVHAAGYETRALELGARDRRAIAVDLLLPFLAAVHA